MSSSNEWRFPPPTRVEARITHLDSGPSKRAHTTAYPEDTDSPVAHLTNPVLLSPPRGREHVEDDDCRHGDKRDQRCYRCEDGAIADGENHVTQRFRGIELTLQLAQRRLPGPDPRRINAILT